MRHCSEGYNTHLWGLWGDRWQNVPFESKPRHVTPQINHLGKMNTVLRVSLHTFMGFPEEIDGKMFIFRVNLGMWPSNRSSWKIEHCSEGFNTHLWVSQGDRWKNVPFESKARHVTPQIDHLGKMSTVLSVSLHIEGVSEEIDGKMFLLRVNLGMWPLKLNISEKQALFWWFQHIFMGFLRR